MARSVFGSQNITDTTSSIQLFSSASAEKIFAVTFKARAGNAEAVFLGNDSAIKTGGLELLPGDVHASVYHPLTVAAKDFWVFGNDSGDDLDWEVLRES